MAFPTIPTSAAGRIVSSANLSPAGTHTFPNLNTLTSPAGDLIIAIVIMYDGNTTNAEFSSWGGGFTEFVDQATATTMGIGAAYKWSNGAETGTFTVTSSDTSTNDSQCILLSIPGAHPSTPPEGGTIVNGTAAAANIAALNPSGWDVEDTLWIAVGGSGEDATTGSFTGIASAPTNYTDYFETGISADVVGGVEAAVAFRQLAAASDDPGTFSVDVSNARNSALLLAVRPLAITDAPAGTAAVTVTAEQAAANVAPNAGNAAVGATAEVPTVETGGNSTNAPAETATVTVAAGGVTGLVSAGSGTASVAAAANNSSGLVSTTPTAALATATAGNSTGQVALGSGTALVTATANNSTGRTATTPTVAPVNAVANAPTITTSGNANAPAQTAVVNAVANSATVETGSSVNAQAQTANVTVAANNSAGTVLAAVGIATVAVTAHGPAIPGQFIFVAPADFIIRDVVSSFTVNQLQLTYRVTDIE